MSYSCRLVRQTGPDIRFRTAKNKRTAAILACAKPGMFFCWYGVSYGVHSRRAASTAQRGLNAPPSYVKRQLRRRRVIAGGRVSFEMIVQI